MNRRNAISFLLVVSSLGFGCATEVATDSFDDKGTSVSRGSVAFECDEGQEASIRFADDSVHVVTPGTREKISAVAGRVTVMCDDSIAETGRCEGGANTAVIVSDGSPNWVHCTEGFKTCSSIWGQYEHGDTASDWGGVGTVQCCDGEWEEEGSCTYAR